MLHKEHCEHYPASALVRMRLDGENVTALYIRTIKRGLSTALVTCSTCSTVFKQDGSPQCQWHHFGLGYEKLPRVHFKVKDNRLAPGGGTLSCTFQESYLLEFQCDYLNRPIYIVNTPLNLLCVHEQALHCSVRILTLF